MNIKLAKASVVIVVGSYCYSLGYDWCDCLEPYGSWCYCFKKLVSYKPKM